MRDFDLPRHGLRVIPYTGGASFTRAGDYFAYSADHDALGREIARLSPCDVDGYERYMQAVMRQCRFVRPLLLRTPATRWRPARATSPSSFSSSAASTIWGSVR